MSNRRKKQAIQERRQEKRQEQELEQRRKLAAEGRLVNGVVIPEGAIAADLSKQAPNNSYSPPLYYADVEFACIDCGSTEIWTAEQQQWYYEEAKGLIYATAVRCRDCRKKQRAEKEEQRRRMRESMNPRDTDAE